MDSDKCLFMRWATLANQEGLFDPGFFQLLHGKHELIHELMLKTKSQFDAGEKQAMKLSLEQLFHAFQKMEEYIAQLT